VSRRLEILGVQAAPHAVGAPFAAFAAEARAARAAHPAADILLFPEMHLFHGDNDALRAAAVPLDGPLDRALAALAAELGVVLVPGTLVEAGGDGGLYNTARVYGRDGAVLATYRKVFPWRPTEPFDPGADWVTFDLPQGRVGLTICYDAWYPEATRQVAWMGAELVINLVKTTTADRPQELVLARANAIVNQLHLVSLNCAAPVGKGFSLAVDPEGHVLAETGAEARFMSVSIDLDRVTHVRRDGTCGENRLWAQFRAGEAPIALPAYAGRIDPADWNPAMRLGRGT
jgi:predicted amidohydrolase